MTTPERENDKKARAEAKRLENKKDAQRRIKALEAENEKLKAIIAKQLY